MAYAVSKLKIDLQNNSNLYYASWSFNANTPVPGSGSSSGTVKAGDWVKVKSGATWSGGVSISSFVFGLELYVEKVSGNLALLTKDKTGKYNVMSWIETKYLSGGSGSSGGTSSGTTKNTLDHFEVQWQYSTGNKVWFGNDTPTNTTQYNNTYTAPDNAVEIRVRVRPVAKTYKEGDNDKPYWTGSWTTVTRSLTLDPPDKPPTPHVEIDQYKLTATVEGITDPNTLRVLFEVFNKGRKVKSGMVYVYTGRAVYTCDISAGGQYTVRCKGQNGRGTYGEYSDYSDETLTAPSAVTNVTCVADSKTSVKLTWTAVDNADSYEIRYAKKKAHLDTNNVSTTTVEGTTAYVTGLDTGEEWFFQVRAKNGQGESGWSEPVSTIIGSAPEAPTTWSLTSTAIVGDNLIVYWTHNTEDGSRQTKAEIQFDIGGKINVVTVPGTPVVDEDDPEPVYFYEFASTGYSDGAVIKWKVRTMGITEEFSEWSTQREIKLYAPPTLEMSLDLPDGVLSILPLEVTATSGPANQTPMSYHVSIVARDSYETTDAMGHRVAVIAGTEVYSKVFNVSDRELGLSLSGGDMILERYQYYTFKMEVSMDSGLSASNSDEFYVDWGEYEYIPDASIGIDEEQLTASITPYCLDVNGILTDDVLLSVYRREANGKLTQIAVNLANTWVDTVVDPHPALDYARYRIVAQHVGTGAVSYTDIEGIEIGEHGIVIQWDEEWSNYDYTEAFAADPPPWSGSMLRLRYNIDVSESYAPDVEFVEYIGREHPVSYFGTQRGETASWSTVIPATDKETLYALRRLAAWNGNAYVREPSGIGYWAHVQVGLSQKHLDPTIPVTFSITRVEGGM